MLNCQLILGVKLAKKSNILFPFFVFDYLTYCSVFLRARNMFDACVLQLSEQEDLIVWMRTAALPTFRKLYGKIEQDLQPNDVISVTLQNRYNTYLFNGKKMLVLSTTSWLGGKNDFLGIAYLTVGGLCFFLAMLFTLIYLVKPR